MYFTDVWRKHNFFSHHPFPFKDVQTLELKSISFLSTASNKGNSNKGGSYWLDLKLVSVQFHVIKKWPKNQQISVCLQGRKKCWYLQEKRKRGDWIKHIKTVSVRKLYLSFPLLLWDLILIVVVTHQSQNSSEEKLLDTKSNIHNEKPQLPY